ncbi:MAG TPA: 3-hydroxy-3-methylglutaryl-CoA reductase [Spirochaetia bacterium]|nr:3-hydroxy-3-methylglutaryl-CoA reductase [Spirochaetia bacterium]
MDKTGYDGISTRFRAKQIKNQDLEGTVFRELFDSNADHVSEALAQAARIRAEAIESETGVGLPHIAGARTDNGRISADGRLLPGIEMKVGAAVIPMGIAGPVRVLGENADGEYYIPLATNEAALVAGVQRGIKAINLSGGIHTLVEYDGMSRAPLLEAPDIGEARRFCVQVEEDGSMIRELQTHIQDPFVRLESIDPYQLGTKVFLRLNCKTGDAMGMNGVTKAAADICRALLRRLPEWKLITISSNLCTDKKAAHINVLNGRGKSVHAEVTIPAKVLSAVFRAGVTARAVERVVFHKCYLGSALSGTLTGFNVNAANTIAALFAATGQDLAQVVTSSSCFVQADEIDGALHFMVSLPSLEVATTGGGTMYGTAQEALRLMHCDGRGDSIDDNYRVLRLAEIMAAAVAALDLNTACAQAAGYEMADSHVKLARGEEA